MEVKLLPVGSVVKLKEAEKRLVVIGILQRNGDGEIYDYLGCPYPEGFVDSDAMFLFNHQDLADVSYLGYDDIERQAFIKSIESAVNGAEEE